MANAKLTIDTRLDNSEIPKDLKRLKDLVDEGAEEATAKVTEQVKKMSDSWQETANKIKANNDEITHYKDVIEEVGSIAEEISKRSELVKVSESRTQTRLLNEEMESLRNKMNSLDADKAASSLKKAQLNSESLDNKMTTIALQSKNLSNSLGVGSKNTAGLNNNLKSVEKTTKSISKDTKNISEGMGNGLKSALKWGGALIGIRSIYGAIQKGMRAYSQETEQGAIMQEQLNALWVQLGAIVAPIFGFLVSLASALLGYIQALTKTFFGFEVSTKSVVKSTGKALGNIKQMRKELAGFDEVNILNSSGQQNLGGGGSGGGQNPISPEANPMVERLLENLRKLKEALLEPLRAISLENLNTALQNVWTSLQPIMGLGVDFLNWFYYEFLVPLAQWTIEDLLPAFLNLLTGALDLLFIVLTVINPLLQFLWYDILVPMGSFVGDAIVEFIGSLTIFLSNLGERLNGDKGILNWFLNDVMFPLAEIMGTAVLSFVEVLTDLLIAFGDWISDEESSIWWFLDIFLIPLASIVGTAAIDFFTILNDLLQKFGNWIKGNQGAMDYFFTSMTVFITFLVLQHLGGQVWLFFLNIVFHLAKFKNALALMNVPLLITNAGLVALVAGILLVASNWSKMNGLERVVSVLGLLAIAATVAAVAVGAFQSAWTLGLAAVAIAAGVVAITASVNSAGKRAKSNASENAKLPKLARGGYATRATTAIIGEAGREAVVPLQNNTGWVEDFVDTVNSKGGMGQGGANGTIVNIFQIDGKEVAREVKEIDKENSYMTNQRGYVYG